MGSLGKWQNRDSRRIWVLLRPSGARSCLSGDCRGWFHFSSSGNRRRRAVLWGKLFRGFESLRAQRDKYFPGITDQHGRGIDRLHSSPARSSFRDVLSAGSAAIQSVSDKFYFHKSEFSNRRISPDITAIYDSSYQEFPVRARSAGQPDD